MSHEPPKSRLIRRREVEFLTGLSCSSIYARLTPDPRRPRLFDPTFPRPVKIGERAVAWDNAQVLEWIEARKNKSHGN
ncbi:helix-turn-helix transcriptional regulator [Piscinibacterium candidicorallinum]|uniref:Helix-turn-helix transcriptional regulator n=1 Tax=Piscinibacterium candidicorallinum TaxID=1793872 RepID=A0ABV7H3T1_9BURK